MDNKLIEYIYEKSNESCLSELKIPHNFNKYMPIILEITEEEFSLEAWEYLLYYITNKKSNIKTIRDAKEQLKLWLK